MKKSPEVVDLGHRHVQRLSSGPHYVTLPKSWVLFNQIKKGSKLKTLFDRNRGDLILKIFDKEVKGEEISLPNSDDLFDVVES